jgi:hypothetical protein
VDPVTDPVPRVHEKKTSAKSWKFSLGGADPETRKRSARWRSRWAFQNRNCV